MWEIPLGYLAVVRYELVWQGDLEEAGQSVLAQFSPMEG